jgi:hypothetical protein
MKYYILLLMTILHCSFAYDLLDVWLTTTSDSCKVYLTHEVDSLAASWGLNFSNCISDVNAHYVTNTPVLVAAETTSENALCIIRYDSLPSPAEDNTVAINELGGIVGEISSFTIKINKNKFNPAVHDINVILQHELVHAFGLNDITDPTALMNGDTSTRIATTITNDEKNGIKNVYELPKIKVITPHTFSNDTAIVFDDYTNSDSLEFEVTTPKMLEHNSVTPPSLSLVGFFTAMNDQYYGSDADFDSLGNDTYRYKTDMAEFILENGSDPQKLRTYVKRAGFPTYGDYWSENSPDSSLIFEIKPAPEVIYPTPDDIILIKPSNKAIALDTLDIKIRVPEVLGSYPNIRLKIDGVYVEQSEIVLQDTVYVYPWILNTVTSDPLGRRIKIEPELFDDPNCRTTSEILTVEAVFLETFQEVTDLEAEGWNVTEYAYPLYTCAANGWMIGPDPTYIKGEKCGRTYSTNSTSFIYQLYTPAFTVPDSSISKTKLEYKLYFKYNMIPYSYIYFDVCNESGTPLTSSQMLGPAYGLWTNMNYDLSDYSNQTIKLRWKHNYTDGMQNCYFTQYAIDNVAVYRIPDMDSPSIDFVHDNQAYINNDMIVRVEFNDDSDIQSVSADYEIEGDSDTITLLPSKDTYFYSGTIPARDHVCYGSIVFKIKDSVGNETVSEPYSISWIEPGSTVLTAPQNVAITAQTDSTFALTWDMVSGASGYKVYSSLDPYGVFSEDTTGTFTESRKWEKLFDGNKYFYYIIATDETKEKTIKIIKPREIR